MIINIAGTVDADGAPFTVTISNPTGTPVTAKLSLTVDDETRAFSWAGAAVAETCQVVLQPAETIASTISDWGAGSQALEVTIHGAGMNATARAALTYRLGGFGVGFRAPA